jgi:hypothetical protein
MSEGNPPLDSPLRILYVVSAYSGSTTGSGGHYYSARDIASVLQARWPQARLRILALGDVLPKALTNSAVPYVHVSPVGKGLRKYRREIMAAADDFAPTIVHAYDNKSYFFARLIARRHRAKRVLTKPAGPNPGVLFPYCPDIVCFSDENLAALGSRRRLRTSRLHLIANRVARPTPDSARIAALRAIVGPGDVLLRICRIGEYHRRSIEQTLVLAKLMRATGIQVRAVIVGALESRGVLQSLQAGAEAGDLFVTEPPFVVDSAALLDVATYVVGTGRGVVEAAMRRILVFVPLADADIPVLVTPSNWRVLSSSNFSARTRSTRGLDSRDLSQLKELLRDPKSRDGLLAELSSVLSSAYGLDAIPEKYQELYSQRQRTGTVEVFDCLLNSGSFLIPYLRLRWRRRRT